MAYSGKKIERFRTVTQEFKAYTFQRLNDFSDFVHRTKIWEKAKQICTFNAKKYLEKYEDVVEAGMNPYLHFIRFGLGEGRTALLEDEPISARERRYMRPPRGAHKFQIQHLTTPGKTLKTDGIVQLGDQEAASLAKYAGYFSDESVLAVLVTDLVAYVPKILTTYELASDRKLCMQFQAEPSSCLLRAAAGFTVSQADWQDAGHFANFLLRFAAAGKVVLLPDKSRGHKACTPLSDEVLIERIVLMMEYFRMQTAQAAKYLEELRGESAKNSLLETAVKVSAQRSAKRRIMISILGFSFGGGEIMPIRLANCMHEMGWPVLLHITDCVEIDKKVRAMLNAEIPVICTGSAEKLGEYTACYGIELVNTHHQGAQSLCAAMMEKSGNQVRHIATTHGMYEAFEEETLSYILNHQLKNRVDEWICVADKNMIPLKKYGFWEDKAFHKLPNGMQPPVIHPLSRSDYGIPQDAFVFCLISRALVEKGWLVAAKAIAEAREQSGLDLHLLLIGEGEAYDLLKNAPQQPFVHLMGFKQYPCDWYAISDAGILPTFYHSESAPLTLIESLQCGKPFLSTDIGEIAEMLQTDDGMAGMVFPLEDGNVNLQTLTSLMIKMASDRPAYEKMCEQAKMKAKLYSIGRIAQQYLDVYNADLEPAEDSVRQFHWMYEHTLELLRRSKTGENSPHVTVIVPNYNHAEYLCKRLESIYNQTYRNFDVLLLDDCSTDGSPALLREYAARYPERTKLLINEVNSGGVFYQWRRGIQNACGDLCWIAESDDWCDVTFLEKTVPLFCDDQVRLACAHYVFGNQAGKVFSKSFENYLSEFTDAKKWELPFSEDAQTLAEAALAVGNGLPNVSGVLFRRPVQMSLLGDPSWSGMKICGDWAFYLYLAYGGRIAYTNLTNSYFRIADGSAGNLTYKTPLYYAEHERIACMIAALYHPPRKTMLRMIERVRKFSQEQKVSEIFAESFHEDVILNLSAEKAEEIRNEAEAIRFLPMKTVLVRQIERVRPEDRPNREKAFWLLGENTGNLLFTEAVVRQVKTSDVVEEPFAEDFSYVRGTAGILPVSNFILPGGPAHISDTLRVYEQTDVALTMVGMGAQTDYRSTTPEKLVKQIDEQKKHLLRQASTRAVTLGVRGRFTAKCLEALGIFNYRIVGCPSIFEYFDGVWPKLNAPSMERPVICVTRNQAAEKTPALQSKIIRLGMQTNAEWILQMPTEVPPSALDGIAPCASEIHSCYPEENWEEPSAGRYFAEHIHWFFDDGEWQRYLKQGGFTFAFGSRFHGIVAALRAGIPGLLLVHDSRTLELAETTRLPYLTPEQFETIDSMEQLIGYCDYTEFYESYGERLSAYARFLEENGIPHRLRVKRA